MINSYTLVVACVEVKENIVIGWCVNKVECDTSWVRWVARWGRREQPVYQHSLCELTKINNTESWERKKKHAH